MPVRKVYLDTSVIGGYYDVEFKEETRKLWKKWEAGEILFYTSVLTFEEVAEAPSRVKELLRRTFPRQRKVLMPKEESRRLAQAYLEAGAVPERYASDARHVADCSVAGIVYLVSWNFKHLVNINRENAFNAVNLLHDYPTLRILSPKELIYGDEKEL